MTKEFDRLAHEVARAAKVWRDRKLYPYQFDVGVPKVDVAHKRHVAEALDVLEIQLAAYEEAEKRTRMETTV